MKQGRDILLREDSARSCLRHSKFSVRPLGKGLVVQKCCGSKDDGPKVLIVCAVLKQPHHNIPRRKHNQSSIAQDKC